MPIINKICIGCDSKFDVLATCKRQKYCSKKCYLTNTKTTGTAPENEVANILGENGIDFIRNKKVKNYFVDFYIPKFNLGIEVDGDFWHCNPDKFENDYFHPVKQKTAEDI